MPFLDFHYALYKKRATDEPQPGDRRVFKSHMTIAELRDFGILPSEELMLPQVVIPLPPSPITPITPTTPSSPSTPNLWKSRISPLAPRVMHSPSFPPSHKRAREARDAAQREKNAEVSLIARQEAREVVARYTTQQHQPQQRQPQANGEVEKEHASVFTFKIDRVKRPSIFDLGASAGASPSVLNKPQRSLNNDQHEGDHEVTPPDSTPSDSIPPSPLPESYNSLSTSSGGGQDGNDHNNHNNSNGDSLRPQGFSLLPPSAFLRPPSSPSSSPVKTPSSPVLTPSRRRLNVPPPITVDARTAPSTPVSSSPSLSSSSSSSSSSSTSTSTTTSSSSPTITQMSMPTTPSSPYPRIIYCYRSGEDALYSLWRFFPGFVHVHPDWIPFEGLINPWLKKRPEEERLQALVDFWKVRHHPNILVYTPHAPNTNLDNNYHLTSLFPWSMK
jgi:hypothetical protein